MKVLKFFVFAGCLLCAGNGFAQTPKLVEADLVKAFGKIEYWSQKQQADTSGDISIGDSLGKANDIFGEKLKHYTNTYPFTLHQPFNRLHVDIAQSADGLFRIYSWDTELGGTEHDFRNVMQCQNSKGVRSVLNLDTSAAGDAGYVYCFDKLYTLKAGAKTYYLGIYDGIFSTKDMKEGVQVFAIENGKLNTGVKIIKTGSGLHNKLHYYYDLFSIPKKLKDADVYYDEATATLTIPVVESDESVTTRRITYKFNGKYFETVAGK